ncbi:MAG: DUF169 domain-containing protein [Methanobacterium sp.]
MKISNDSIREIGESLKKAARLDTFPLVIYGSDNMPDNAIPMCSNDQCVAKSILITALDKKEPPIYLGKDSLRGCCPGAMTYLGFKEPLEFIKYFVSTGNPKFRGGEAEYLKASPQLVEEFQKSIGKIRTPGKYIIIEKSDNIKENLDIKSFLCFGNGEQIRNLSSLIHFRRKTPFEAINMPFGPACSTFVTYPAGMAEKTPKNTAFVGPVDPTGNSWFPPEFMAIGIPLEIARGMHEDIDHSFVTKRIEVAYPKIRENIGLP